jgi:MFS family permease
LSARPSRAVAVLCACQAALNLGLGLAFPFFAIYLHRERGVPLAQTGAWLSLGVLATAVSQGLGGELSDRFGRRRVMVLALWGRAASVAGLALAVAGYWSVGALIGLHVASNFVAHFFEPAARGWIADHASGAERHRAYAWLRIASSAGFAVGPAIGGLLADRSFAGVFAASAAVCLLCALAATLALGRDADRERPDSFSLSGWTHAAGDPRFLRLCVLYALISTAMAQLVVPLSVYATRFVGLKDSQVGLLLSLNGLLVVLLQIPATHWISGIPMTTTLAAGCMAYAAGYAWVGWAGGFAALALAVSVVTVGEILVPPTVQALAANLAPPRQRGRYLGFFGLSRQLGSALGPAAGCASLEVATAHGWTHGHWAGVMAVAIVAALGFRALANWVDPAEDGMPDLFPETEDDLRASSGA